MRLELLSLESIQFTTYLVNRTMTNKTKDTISQDQKVSDKNIDRDDFDVREIIASSKRNFRLFVSVAFGTVLFSGFYAYTRKPVWQGGFQMVVETSQQGSKNKGGLQSSVISSISSGGINQAATAIATEVKILTSPLILRPIFQEINEEYLLSGKTFKSAYPAWSSSIQVFNVLGTRVLNVSYRDKDKEIILPTIKALSKGYANYAGQKRQESINNGLDFVSKQVKFYLKKSGESTRARDSYEFRYGINPGHRDVGAGNLDYGQLFGNVAEEDLVGSLVGNTSGGYDRNAPPIYRLALINREILRRREIFTDEDPSIKILLRERDSVKRYIDQSAAGSIAYLPLSEPLSKEKANEIMLKYGDLNREQMRDSLTLTKLEQTKQRLQLEKSRIISPWKIIHPPAVLPYPVSPNKSRILFIGIVAGMILGSLASFAKDRLSGIIFNSQQLQDSVPFSLLKRLPFASPETWMRSITLLAEGPLTVSGTGQVALIPLGRIPSKQLDEFSSQLRKALKNRDLVITRDLLETRNCSTQLFLCAPGYVKTTQINDVRDQVSLQGKPITGWVMLDPDLMP